MRTSRRLQQWIDYWLAEGLPNQVPPQPTHPRDLSRRDDAELKQLARKVASVISRRGK